MNRTLDTLTDLIGWAVVVLAIGAVFNGFGYASWFLWTLGILAVGGTVTMLISSHRGPAADPEDEPDQDASTS